MCLRCKRVAHVRRNCDTPFCRHRGEYGHATEGCSAEKVNKTKRSYASVAAVSNVSHIDMEGPEGDEIDLTELRNNSVCQSESAAPGLPRPQRVVRPLKRDESAERDVPDACSRPRWGNRRRGETDDKNIDDWQTDGDTDISNKPLHPSFISCHCVETGVGRPPRISPAPAAALRH